MSTVKAISRYRSRCYRAFSKQGPAAHFWLSLMGFYVRVIASFVVFEQQTQAFLTHLNLALMLIALLALDGERPAATGAAVNLQRIL